MTGVTSQTLPHTQKEEALGMFGGSAGVLVFIPIDLMVFGFVPGLMALRLVWGLCLLGAGFYLLRASNRGRQVMVLAAAVVSSLGFLGNVALTGGMASPYIMWLTALSMSLAPTSRSATAVSASVLVVGTSAMFFSEPTWAIYALSALFAGGLAQYTAFLFHRSRCNETKFAALLSDSERRRRESDRLAVLGQLAGGVAHEINNPLGCIKGNITHLLEEDLGDSRLSPTEREQLLKETLRGVDRIASIVKDLRSFSSDEQPAIAPAHLRAAVDAAIALTSLRLGQVNARHECSVDRALPRVLVQQERLTRVLASLLMNSADALELRGRGGRVRLHAELTPGGLRLTLDDDGPGIVPAILERVFDPFFTTKPPGKGIGLSLALAREYLTRMGATIVASNGPSGGARFSIELRTEPEIVRSPSESADLLHPRVGPALAPMVPAR